MRSARRSTTLYSRRAFVKSLAAGSLGLLGAAACAPAPTSLPEGQDLLEAVSDMWRAVGVQTNLETLATGAYVTRQRALGFDSAVYVFGSGQAQNRGTGFENYAWESLFLQAIRTLDDAKRNDLLREAGDMSYIQHFYVPLFWLRNEVVGYPKVISSFTFPGVSTAYFSFLNGAKSA